MTVREAAAELQCSISFVYKLMAQGQVAYECRGRRKLPVAEYRHRNLVPATATEPKPTKAPYQYKHLFQDHRGKPSARLS
jgi:transposase